MGTLRLSLCVIMLTSSALAFKSKVDTTRDVVDMSDIANIDLEGLKDIIKSKNPSSIQELGNILKKMLTGLSGTDSNKSTGKADDVNGDEKEARKESEENSRDKRGLGVCLHFNVAGIGEILDCLLGAAGLSEYLLTLLNLPKKIIDFILGLPFSLLPGLSQILLPGLSGLLGNGGLIGGLLGGKGGDLLGGGLLGGALGSKDSGLLGGALGSKDSGLLGGALGSKDSGLLGGALGSKDSGLLGGALGSKDSGLLGGDLGSKDSGLLGGDLGSKDSGLLGGDLGSKDSGLLGGALGSKDSGLLGGALGSKDSGLLGGALGSKGGGLLGGTLGKRNEVLSGTFGSLDEAAENASSASKSLQSLTSVPGHQGSVGVGHQSADGDVHIKKRFLLLDSVQLVHEMVSLVYTTVMNLIKEILLSFDAGILGTRFLKGLPLLGPLNSALLGNVCSLNVLSRSLTNTGVIDDLASLRVDVGTHNLTDDGFLLGLSVDYVDKLPQGIISSLTNGILSLETSGFSLGGLTDRLKNIIADNTGSGSVSGTGNTLSDVANVIGDGDIKPPTVIENLGNLGNAITNTLNGLSDVIGDGIAKSSTLNNPIANIVNDLQNTAIEGSKQALNSLMSSLTGSKNDTAGASKTGSLVEIAQSNKTLIGNGNMNPFSVIDNLGNAITNKVSDLSNVIDDAIAKSSTLNNPIANTVIDLKNTAVEGNKQATNPLNSILGSLTGSQSGTAGPQTSSSTGSLVEIAQPSKTPVAPSPVTTAKTTSPAVNFTNNTLIGNGNMNPFSVIGNLGNAITNKVSDLSNVIDDAIAKSSTLNNPIANTVSDLKNAAIEGSKQATNPLNSILASLTGSQSGTAGPKTSSNTGSLVDIAQPSKTPVAPSPVTTAKTTSPAGNTGGLLSGLLSGVIPKSGAISIGSFLSG